jgi:hypothetical protein
MDPTGTADLEAFIGGDYILRGAGLGNGDILDGRAWVLENPTPPAPLYREAGEPAEEQEFGLGGCPALMEWLAAEIGVPAEEIDVVVANAFASSTDIQPCEVCARLKSAADLVDDTAAGRATALAGVIATELGGPLAGPPSPEQMASIATALSTAAEGTQYASAAELIDAVVAYVGAMIEMGFSGDDAVAMFMANHGDAVTEDASVAAYVSARLAALGG